MTEWLLWVSSQQQNSQCDMGQHQGELLRSMMQKTGLGETFRFYFLPDFLMPLPPAGVKIKQNVYDACRCIIMYVFNNHLPGLVNANTQIDIGASTRPFDQNLQGNFCTRNLSHSQVQRRLCVLSPACQTPVYWSLPAQSVQPALLMFCDKFWFFELSCPVAEYHPLTHRVYTYTY